MKKKRAVESIPKRRPSERKFISFFSGALGLDTGLGNAGLRCLAANEFEPVFCETIRANRPDLRLFDCDIRRLNADQLLRELKLEKEELFAVVGGPPCQAFSTAGRRLGLNDERGNVFLHFIDLVRELRPKYVLFENVRGLLSAPLSHRPHDRRGRGFPPLSQEERPGGALLHILRLLEDAGYSVAFNLYNTANFGVPQIRERLIFFGSRTGSKVPFMTPTHDESGEGGLPRWHTIRQALAPLRGTHHHAGQFPERRLKFYRMLKEGQNWRDLPQRMQKDAMGRSFYAGGGKTGFYRRLAWDKPAPTLVTSPTMPATDLCHPKELRPLSVQEYAAIQTFPHNYVFKGQLADQYRQIGNAVPCVFGEAIGRHLIAFDDGRLTEPTQNTRLSRYSGTDHETWRESVAYTDRQMVLMEEGGTGNLIQDEHE
jgi:DNA (cytosine-5)-methyltransferase 1